MKRETFDTLYKVNVNERTEKKNGLTYLSWAWAWAEFVKVCPDAKYEIKTFDGKPYLFDEKLGYMVFTSITADGDTKEMWLPVMDQFNKAMTDHPYKYTVKGIGRQVEQATMFDINKTIMRCLTKNISMFGLGLYIYAGEDLPEEEEKKSEIFDEPIPANNLKALADEFRQLYTADEQKRILDGLHYTKAEEIGMNDLQKYINFKKYGKK